MYHNPVKIIETNDFLSEVFIGFRNYNIKSPLLITSPSIVKLHKIDVAFNPYSTFIVNNPNPDIISCQKILDFCSTKKFDGIIAIGGGSVMDTAKVAMASLGLGINDIRTLLKNSESLQTKILSIFIPTTHGSGSETTMWATVWDMKQKKKYSLSNPNLYAALAILDGSLMLSLPIDISLTTTLDALSHSFEAIWNKNSNSISTNYAIEAICLILENVDKLKKEPENIEIRNNLIRASMIAGLAFSNTKTAAAHSISYPLTMRYNIPHGIAASISLTGLIKIQENKIGSSIDLINQKLKLATVDELIEKIHAISKNCLKYTLSEWGVDKDSLKLLAAEAFANERINNNLVTLSKDDVYTILLNNY
jgi:phosphonate metabolism-associated iron-containing alcohol dehydrogenase